MNHAALAVLSFTLPLLAQAPMGTIEGRVLGPLGDPLPNVEVVATADPRAPGALAKTRTDGDGMFVLARVPCDRPCSVVARLPGHTVALGFAALGPDRPNTTTQLRLWQANTLRGRIVDPAGKPIAGAAVLGTKDYTWFSGGFLSPETTTDAKGRFELPGVPIGDNVVRAWAPGFEMAEHKLITVEDTEVEVRLAPGDGTLLAIHAKGLPEELRPQTTVRIYATRRGSGFALPRAIETGALDEAGRFLCKGLPNAEWHVQLEAPGHTFEPRSVTTREGQFVNVLAFTASADGEVTLRGVLRDLAGVPLAGQTLVCRTKRSPSRNGGRPAMATTDADGRFALAAPLVLAEPYSLHLLGSTYVLQQTKERGHTGSTDLRYGVRWEETADPTRELVLVAAPAAFVTARLVDENGRPFPFADAQLEGERQNVHPPFGAIAYATALRDGTLRFAGFHGSDATLRIAASGPGGSGISETFTVAPGERIDVVVTMQSAGRVRGRVFGADGKPAAGVRVTMSNWDVATGQQTDGGWTNVASDRDGRFVFLGVAPGGHRLASDRHEPAAIGRTDIFAVEPGGVVEVELRLER